MADVGGATDVPESAVEELVGEALLVGLLLPPWQILVASS